MSSLLRPPRTSGSGALASVLAGAISGTLIVTFAITFASVIFTGRLASHLAAGIGILLVSSCVLAGLTALRSSFKPVIAAPQENTSIILAVVAAAAVERAPAESAFPTAVVTMALATLATGAVFLVLGVLRLGRLVRFVPYPVVGGFLAGSGWLLAQGALSVMAGAPIDAHNVATLAAPSAIVLWLPGIAFGVILAVATRRCRHVLVLPVLVAAGVAMFYGVVALSGVGVAGASARGLLLGPFPEGGFFEPVTLETLAHASWPAIAGSAGGLAGVPLLAAVSFLLNASGLEVTTGAEIDLDRELRTNGVANLACGVAGGVPGYLSLTESAMNHRIGSRSRAAGLICAAICAASLAVGSSAFGYFPKPVLGGLLFFFGLSFLIETLYDSFFRLPRVEYALVLFILAVTLAAGFLEGVGAGVVGSALLFAINYARVDVVKRAATGKSLRSKADRSCADEAVLDKLGDRIEILQLQGYVFFGTAHHLLERVRGRIAASDRETESASSGSRARVELLILDFRQVHGLDSSAIVSFERLRRMAEDAGTVLVFTDLPDSIRRSLARGGVIDHASSDRANDDAPAYLVLPDLDHGLEWCEDRLLIANAAPHDDPRAERETARRRALVDALLGYFERVEAPAGQALFDKGDTSRDLLLIESGELEAWIDLGDGRQMRLRTMGPGNVVGEAGLYLGASRSASVRTTRPSILHRLSEPALERMTEEAPRLAAEFQRLVATLLAARLVSTTDAPQSFFY